MGMTAATSPAATGVMGEFAAALRELGVSRGDLLYVQVCNAAFPVDGVPPESRAAELYRVLREAVGEEGTLLVPTFTFSFCRQEEFDVKRTPTVSGPWQDFTALAELVRTMPGAIRSADPIFSTAGIGPRAGEILTGLPAVCLGADSVHDRLRRAGGKICLLGIGLHEAIFRHHVEATKRVPWRYNKLFTGHVIKDGRRSKEGWIYNVRIRASNGDPAGEAIA